MEMNRKYKCFPITGLKPEGWLKKQFQIQMNGLTGKLYDLWSSVGSYSGWLGGTGDNWERAPYYLDGLLPLAHYLQDQEKWDLCMRFITWTLDSQDQDGNFGPINSKSDYWSRFLMLKVLIQYGEITDDKKVSPFIEKYLDYVVKETVGRPVTGWSRARVADMLYVIKWYCEENPQKDVQSAVEALCGQALDWGDFFSDFPYPRPAAYYYDWHLLEQTIARSKLNESIDYHGTHIVNVTMGVKYPALRYFFTGDKKYYDQSRQAIEVTRKYHGVVSGAVNGDEHLSGASPSQGSELCSVVEYMFSLQSLLEIFGDADFADLLERLAYNALPATISEDFMAHQYLQQANQVLCSDNKRNWFDNDDTANMFGLEPHFGCCTANMHQGWPKFLKSLWYYSEDSIVSMVFAPSQLKANLNGDFEISLKTDYPFRNELRYNVVKAEGQKLDFRIRVPGWCTAPEISLNGTAIKADIVDGFVHLHREWNTDDTILVKLPMEAKITHWYNDSIAIERGPLVFASDLPEDWNIVKDIAGVKDYEISTNEAWNYALPEQPSVTFEERDMSDVPFSKNNPSVIATGTGRLLPKWGMLENSAAPPPQSPVQTDEPEKQLRFIPFGCSRVRISQFPWYSQSTLKQTQK